ncbi:MULTISPECIES: DegQ family serine endoprotease [Oleiagrimonas]|uniref:Probable periplasmic serine endoprotease DegP-like n=1 Tax=Oleiagrimonas citrea TaxID=1665687 RepID=A0A846ZMU6_9GAMM|nr:MULTISPECIES: DegQ family serine endoprotease [Oleiagrimonas]NKZ39162.1 DegQ family serine endoprotease [Oleiagrimonas citrea]RAP57762.1 protease Do [Oleiagrimonas sp. MCCC 1A03011]
MRAITMRLGATFGLLMLAIGAQAAQLPDFTGIVSKNAPAVVHVEAKYDGGKSPSMQMQQQGGPDQQQIPEILRRFFGGPMGPQEDPAHTSLGSGFIISSDGYILTNDHVVDDADSVTVRLQDHRTFKAKVVGSDKLYDIALLKVKAHDLPTVSIGDSSKLKPGQWVLAIGSPFGFDYTVTQGIVSAVGRNLGRQDQPYTSFIQTDVPINRGNSGGPLFNLDGQVVGINSQIYSNTGGYMGVSFSIPIDLAMNAVQQLKTKGHVSRGMIGVGIQNVDQDKAKALGLADVRGALVRTVNPGSPGDRAGLKVGDVITDFDGRVVNTASDLPPMVAATAPGTECTLKVIRDGKTRTIKVKLGELKGNGDGPSAGSMGSSSSKLGFSVQSMTDDQRQMLGLKRSEGGVVIDHVDGRNAAEAGLRPGDVVLMVGRKKVSTVSQFDKAIAEYKPGSTVMLLVRDRGGNTAFVTVTAAKPGSE